MKTQIWRGIGTLLTLEGVAQKSARKVSEQDLGFVKNAAVIAKGGVLHWAGPEKRIPKEFQTDKGKGLEFIDCKGGTVLPAWIECHTHSLFAGQRSHELEQRNLGWSYSEITAQGGGIYSTVKASQKASDEELLSLTQARVDFFKKQGVAVLEIKTGYGLTLNQELRHLKILTKLQGPEVVPTFLGAHAIFPKGSSAQDHLRRMLKLRKLAGDRVKRVDIFIDKGFFDPEISKGYLQQFKEAGFDLTIHADQLSDSGAAVLGVELGALSVDHVLKTSENGLKAIAKSETTAVLLPIADFYLKCPYPQARKMIDMGARVALSTDFNPGTSPCMDLNFLGLLSRLEMKMTLPEVISAMTLGAAFALGKGHQLGALLPGRPATLQIIDQEWSDLFYTLGEGLRAKGLWHCGKKLLRS